MKKEIVLSLLISLVVSLSVSFVMVKFSQPNSQQQPNTQEHYVYLQNMTIHNVTLKGHHELDINISYTEQPFYYDLSEIEIIVCYKYHSNSTKTEVYVERTDTRSVNQSTRDGVFIYYTSADFEDDSEILKIFIVDAQSRVILAEWQR